MEIFFLSIGTGVLAFLAVVFVLSELEYRRFLSTLHASKVELVVDKLAPTPDRAKTPKMRVSMYRGLIERSRITKKIDTDNAVTQRIHSEWRRKMPSNG